MIRASVAVTAIALAAVAIAVQVREAEACSGCIGAHFVPEDGATVPANVPALYWRPGRVAQPADPALVTLARADAPESPLLMSRVLAAGGEYLLVPDAPLEPGVTYILRDPRSCASYNGVTEKRSTFTVGPVVPLPAELGTLGIVDNDQAVVELEDGASCTTDAHVARSVVALELTTGAEPWRSMLFFETRVDGAPWRPISNSLEFPAPGASWIGRGVDAVYAVCASEGSGASGLSEGAHAVELRATLPGTTLAFRSNTITTTLTCGELPSNGGCRASGRDGGPLALAALAALVVLLRRRRARA